MSVNNYLFAKETGDSFDEWMRKFSKTISTDVVEQLGYCDEVVVYGELDDTDEILEEVDTLTVFNSVSDKRIKRDPSKTCSFIATMESVGIQNAVFCEEPQFFPFSRQHYIMPTLPHFTYNHEIVDIVFPPVSYEPFTEQFKNNLGVLRSDGSILTANVVHNICYGCATLIDADEFVIFSVTGVTKRYYLWDQKTIIHLPNYDGTECYGMMTTSGPLGRNVHYTVVYGIIRSMSLVNVTFNISTWQYLNQQQLNDRSPMTLGLLVNVDGVAYMVPRTRRVILMNKSGRMVDNGGMYYDVDVVAKRRAYYEIGVPFRYIRETNLYADSTTVVNIYKKNVVTMMEMSKHFLIPVDKTIGIKKEIIDDLWCKIPVVVVNDRTQYIQVLNEQKIPFMYRDSSGTSKNAAMMRCVQSLQILSFNGMMVMKYSQPGVFFSNNFYPYMEKHKKKKMIYKKGLVHKGGKDIPLMRVTVFSNEGVYDIDYRSMRVVKYDDKGERVTAVELVWGNRLMQARNIARDKILEILELRNELENKGFKK